jgi:hypothetical protein
MDTIRRPLVSGESPWRHGKAPQGFDQTGWLGRALPLYGFEVKAGQVLPTAPLTRSGMLPRWSRPQLCSGRHGYICVRKGPKQRRASRNLIYIKLRDSQDIAELPPIAMIYSDAMQRLKKIE